MIQVSEWNEGLGPLPKDLQHLPWQGWKIYSSKKTTKPGPSLNDDIQISIAVLFTKTTRLVIISVRQHALGLGLWIRLGQV